MRGVITFVLFIFMATPGFSYEVVNRTCEGVGVGENRRESRRASMWDALMKCAEDVGWKRSKASEENFKRIINPPSTYILGFKELGVTLTEEGKYLTTLKVEIDVNYFKKVLVSKGLIMKKLLVPKIGFKLSLAGKCAVIDYKRVLKEVNERCRRRWSDLLKVSGEKVDYSIEVNLKLEDKKIVRIKWCEQSMNIAVYRSEVEVYSRKEDEKVVPLHGEDINEFFVREVMDKIEDAVVFSLNHWMEHSGLRRVMVRIKPWHPTFRREELKRLLMSTLPQIVAIFVTRVNSGEITYSIFVDKSEETFLQKLADEFVRKGWEVERMGSNEIEVQLTEQ